MYCGPLWFWAFFTLIQKVPAPPKKVGEEEDCKYYFKFRMNLSPALFLSKMFLIFTEKERFLFTKIGLFCFIWYNSISVAVSFVLRRQKILFY